MAALSQTFPDRLIEQTTPLAQLVIKGQFGSELNAAKFAMAYAIKHGADLGSAEGAATKWNVGTVDADGRLKILVTALFPAVAEPYRQIEFLINSGLQMLTGKDGLPPDVADILLHLSSKKCNNNALHG